jgi:hypothetical protein
MKWLVALAAGYVIGATTGGKELENMGRSLKALSETDEFANVVSAARVHVESTLRELAAIVDGEHSVSDLVGNVGARVRHLVDNE